MGENNIPNLKVSFNGSIDIECGSNNVTGDAGALAMQEATYGNPKVYCRKNQRPP